MKPIATANYDFESLIKDGCVYVDKTDMLWKLASSKDALYFISRPRRFGKSLMLSTFKYLFQGKKELFRGLKIEKKWDWSKTYPVIELNMRKTSAPTIGALEKNLWKVARDIAHEHGSSVRWGECGNSGSAFSGTLEAMAKKHGRFVLLIDEYDVPLQTFLRTGKIGAARAMLHDFYGGIKDNVGAIRFMMMTGVSKFTKHSVFSALNYYSGHGSFTDGALQSSRDPNIYGFTPSLGRGCWGGDLDCVIFAGCSVLNIGDYRARSFMKWRTKVRYWFRKKQSNNGGNPGMLWENIGAKYLLGYCWTAPLDTQGATAIASTFVQNIKNNMPAIDAWRDANSSTSTLNACAIDASSIPHKFWYWDETSGVPVWTNAVKGVQSW